MKRSVRRDYYAVLGITATAAPRDIRRAYQRLARQYSPDVNFWDAEARSLFDEIAEAYRVLSDPTARRCTTGTARRSAPARSNRVVTVTTCTSPSSWPSRMLGGE